MNHCTPIPKMKKENDLLWAKLVKSTFCNRCFLCQHLHHGTGVLDAHHIIKRGNLLTRWNPINGVALCRFHHSKVEAGKINLIPFLEKHLPHSHALVIHSTKERIPNTREFICQWNETLKQLLKQFALIGLR